MVRKREYNDKNNGQGQGGPTDRNRQPEQAQQGMPRNQGAGQGQNHNTNFSRNQDRSQDRPDRGQDRNQDRSQERGSDRNQDRSQGRGQERNQERNQDRGQERSQSMDQNQPAGANQGQSHQQNQMRSPERNRMSDKAQAQGMKGQGERHEGGHSREQGQGKGFYRDREGAPRQHSGNVPAPRYNNSRNRSEETVEDIKEDILRLEKEIELEIKEIRSLKL